MTERQLYSIKTFCEAYSVSRTRCYEMLAAGVIASVRVGKHTMIMREDAEAWRASLRRGRAGDAKSLAALGRNGTSQDASR